MNEWMNECMNVWMYECMNELNAKGVSAIIFNSNHIYVE